MILEHDNGIPFYVKWLKYYYNYGGNYILWDFFPLTFIFFFLVILSYFSI